MCDSCPVKASLAFSHRAPFPGAVLRARRALEELDRLYILSVDTRVTELEASRPMRCAAFTLALVVETHFVLFGLMSFAHNKEAWPPGSSGGTEMMSLPHATKLVTRVARYASFPRSVAVQMQDGIELYCMRKKVWAARQAEHKVRGKKNTKVPPPGLFDDVTNALPRRQ